MTAVSQLVHHGMIFIPMGYTAPDLQMGNEEVRGGGPWGAGTFAGAHRCTAIPASAAWRVMRTVLELRKLHLRRLHYRQAYCLSRCTLMKRLCHSAFDKAPLELILYLQMQMALADPANWSLRWSSGRHSTL